MDRTERFHLIDQMLNNARVVSRSRFLETLEVSPATFKRDLEYLRDRLGAPIIWDRELGGYRYEQGDDSYQLPGLWFNTGEIQALLTMQAWLDNLQPGLLSGHIEPLKARIRALLERGDHSAEEITRRIRILSQARIARNEGAFQTISQALLNRRRLSIGHLNRSSGQLLERDISPQRLTFYRDNWYLDSWCHLRQAIRSFAVDAIERVELTSEVATEVSDRELDRELGSGYGIFSGAETRTAELRFSPQRARWVSQEQWHPQQQGEYDEQGYYCLRVPFSQETELLMDILRYGDDVEVIAPADLRASVIDMIGAMQKLYAPGTR